MNSARTSLVEIVCGCRRATASWPARLADAGTSSNAFYPWASECRSTEKCGDSTCPACGRRGSRLFQRQGRPPGASAARRASRNTDIVQRAQGRKHGPPPGTASAPNARSGKVAMSRFKAKSGQWHQWVSSAFCASWHFGTGVRRSVTSATRAGVMATE